MGSLEQSVPPLGVDPSDASRAIMDALADRLSIPLSTSIGTLEAHAADMIGFLREGRFDAFIVATQSLGRAMDSIERSLAQVSPVYEAIRQLDPNYTRAVDKVLDRATTEATQRALEGRKTPDLLAEYIARKIVGDAAGAKSVADILSARGVPVPR